MNHNFSAVQHSSVKLVNCLLCFIRILVSHKRKSSRIPRPAVSGDEDVDDLAILVKERVKIVGGGSESDVEDEKGIGISDIGRTGSSKVRHFCSLQLMDCALERVMNSSSNGGEFRLQQLGL